MNTKGAMDKTIVAEKLRWFILKVIFRNFSALYLFAYAFDIHLFFNVYFFSILLFFKW